MAAISQTTLSNAFSWMKMLEFRLRFHWSLLLRVQLTIIQHWFRYWLGASQATSHYLNQWWLVYWRIYASLGLNELTMKHEHHRLWATAVEDHSAVNYLISTIRFPILVRWYFFIISGHPPFLSHQVHQTRVTCNWSSSMEVLMNHRIYKFNSCSMAANKGYTFKVIFFIKIIHHKHRIWPTLHSPICYS